MKKFIAIGISCFLLSACGAKLSGNFTGKWVLENSRMVPPSSIEVVEKGDYYVVTNYSSLSKQTKTFTMKEKDPLVTDRMSFDKEKKAIRFGNGMYVKAN